MTFEDHLYQYQATCRRVVDGDTLDLDIDLGCSVHVHERIRLFGIDSPETYGVKKISEEYAAGVKARERLAELVMGKPLIVDTHKDAKGKYGRYLGTVWTIRNDGDAIDVGALLVEEGFAVEREY